MTKEDLARHTHYEKDYSLLRPFDLEAAKAGEQICDEACIEKFTLALGQNSRGEVVFETKDGRYMVAISNGSGWKMAPLAWVECRPVYKGDVLWYNQMYREITGCNENGELLVSEHEFVISKNNGGITWKNPKVKKSGWRVVDKVTLNYSKKLAEETAASITNSVAVYGEWEE